MAVIRVGVQAPQGSPGQVVDLDGPRAALARISNASAESIAYSLDGGSSWTTLAAGASGASGVVDAGMLRLRKVASNGAYPAPVDIDATVYGLSDAVLTPAQLAATQALVSGAGIAARKPTAVVLGDSRAAQGYSAGATTIGRYSEGFFYQANALAGNRFEVLNDAGVGGDTLADMLERVQTDVIDYAPKYCFIKGGINSLQTQYAALSAAANFAATSADALALIQALKSAGIVPVIGTEGPKGNTSAAVIAATIAYNDWLRRNASTYGFLVWDWATLAVDPTASGWTPRNPTTWWRDGDALADGTLIHTNNLGAYYEGKLLASLMTALEPQAPRLITGYEDWTNGTVGLPYANILDNPTFQGSGGTNSTAGGITGTVPANWTLAYGSGTPTGTCTVGSWLDPVTGLSMGNYWELTVTAAAATNEILLQSANIGSGTPRAPVGSRISGSGAIQLLTPSNVQQVQLMVTADPGGGGQAVWGGTGGGSYSAGGAVQAMVADTWYGETPEYTVPTGVLAERWYARIKFSGSGAGTVLRVWAPRMRAR